MSDAAAKKLPPTVLSLAQLLEQQPPRRRPAWWSRDCCLRRASCLWAANPRWANPCWWPISPSPWPPARIAPGSPFPLPAGC